MDDRETELGVIGERIVYPGHPVVLAYLIVKRYDTLDEAAAIIDGGFPRVFSDLEVYGGTGCIEDALHLLEAIRGGLSPHQAVENAEAGWVGSRANDHEGSVEKGMAQSKKVRDRFIAEAGAWAIRAR